MKPVLLVIGGPNGSGKTTITVRLRAEHWSEGVEYLNPDDVAQTQFGGWNSNEAVLKAARVVTERREQLLSEIRKVYGHLPEWVAAALDGMPRHADFEHAR